jgi:hypothetical protein
MRISCPLFLGLPMFQLRTLSFRSSKTAPSLLKSQTLWEVLAIVVTVIYFWMFSTYLSKVEAFLVDGLSREIKC